MIPSRSRLLLRMSFRLSICGLVVLGALTAVAQSGRRSVKGSPSIAPPTETKEPEKKPAAADEKQRLDLIIGASRGDVFSGIPPYFSDSVLLSCSRRFSESRTVRVDVVSKALERPDAINSAKAAKEGYVVWLQLRSDSNVPGSDLSDVRIDYWIFESVTAKVKTQGTTYQGAYRNGGGVISPRTRGNNPAIAESLLKDSARDAAERILKALHIASPSDLPTH